ncbi:MAG: hypothetical protein R3F60_30525 [bacterium]
MSWPVTLLCGWLVDDMASRSCRSSHVRKHLLNADERWEDLCGASRHELRPPGRPSRRRASPAASMQIRVTPPHPKATASRRLACPVVRTHRVFGPGVRRR